MSIKKRLPAGLSSTFRKALAGLLLVVLSLTLATASFAGPRSGASFGGRTGFRTGGGFSAPRSSGYGYRGGGTNVYVAPSYGLGWGWGGGYGFGGGGMGSPTSLLVLGVLGIAGAFWAVSLLRRHRASNTAWGVMGGEDDDSVSAVPPGRAYVYRLRLALGRSARGIQDRLTQFAEQGDAETEAGLASLLQQTALELLREKDSIRYAGGEATGPISLTNAETKMNTLALAERARFQVERLRGAGVRLRRSEVAAEEGREALEYVVVTLVVATRMPLGDWKNMAEPSEVAALLSQLGGVSPSGMLGLEVIWTPADPNDSMTETDLMTTYPDLRSV
jgi:uncharacterized membrane protein